MDLKPFKTYTEQIEKLISRGCIIDDKAFAENVLSNLNYYRFSAYFLPFKQKDGSYKQETTFTSIYHTYEFDRKMRSIIFPALASIEIFLRAKIAYYYAGKYGPIGYLDECNFRPNGHDHDKFLKTIKNEISQNAKILFVKHHIDNYGARFPIWVIIELFTFGVLSRFYADLKTQDQKVLAKDMFGLNPPILISWLRCCTDLRNICAHNGRLYYRSFPAFPAGLKEIREKDRLRLFGMIMIIKNLYPNKKNWNIEVIIPLLDLLDKYQDDVNLGYIGFPKDWKVFLIQN